MKQGGGTKKGAAFERDTCQKLSLWVSRGARSDLFTRNDMSGGSFTVRTQKKQDTLTPGDIMAAHPDGNAFLERFNVECKHYKSLEIESFYYNDLGKSFLGRVMAKAELEGQQAGGLSPLLIARQNLRPTLLFCAGPMGNCFRHAAAPFPELLRHHVLHSGKIFCCPFEDVLQYVSIKRLMFLAERA